MYQSLHNSTGLPAAKKYPQIQHRYLKFGRGGFPRPRSFATWRSPYRLVLLIIFGETEPTKLPRFFITQKPWALSATAYSTAAHGPVALARGNALVRHTMGNSEYARFVIIRAGGGANYLNTFPTYPSRSRESVSLVERPRPRTSTLNTDGLRVVAWWKVTTDHKTSAIPAQNSFEWGIHF